MTLRPRDRIALAVVLILALVGASYLLVLKPERQKASRLVTAIAERRLALTSAQSSYAAGRAAKLSIKADAPQWAAVRQAVPNTSDIPGLLRVLERNAAAAHVKMQSLTLTGASTASGAPTTATPSATAGVTSVPLQLTFAGGYTAVHDLVRRLDGLVVVSGGKVHATGPLLSISNVSLTGSPNLTAQITATIYQLAAAAGGQ